MSLLNCVDGEIGRYGSAVTICQDGRRVEAVLAARGSAP